MYENGEVSIIIDQRCPHDMDFKHMEECMNNAISPLGWSEQHRVGPYLFVDPNSELIQKLHELSTEYMELETDDLANAGAFSRIGYEIEELAMELCISNTDLTIDDLVDFLTKHHKTTK